MVCKNAFYAARFSAQLADFVGSVLRVAATLEAMGRHAGWTTAACALAASQRPDSFHRFISAF